MSEPIPLDVEVRLAAVERDVKVLESRVRQNRRGLDANSLGSLGFFAGFVGLVFLLLVLGLQLQFDSSGVKGTYSLPVALLVEAAALPVVGAIVGALIPYLRRESK